ncbi:MAG: lysophospholipid acyltransferase family protein [Verrucomicrobiota bacterium]|jgi:1-acyl-sn-glycerol-3-phosphate acyltransferase
MTARDLIQISFFALVLRPFMTLFIGLRVRGRERLPKGDPFILVANHSSHLDTVSLLNLFPLARLPRLRPVAAADYFGRNRLVSTLSRTFFNILPITRKGITPDTNPLPHMEAVLRAGQSLIIFPEGTRGSGEDLARFHSGAAHLIERCPDVPVVPAYLVNMGRSLPKGEWIPVPFFCEVRLGEPRILRGNCREITAALEAAVRQLREAP